MTTIAIELSDCQTLRGLSLSLYVMMITGMGIILPGIGTAYCAAAGKHLEV
jgi:hypothetical protein